MDARELLKMQVVNHLREFYTMDVDAFIMTYIKAILEAYRTDAGRAIIDDLRASAEARNLTEQEWNSELINLFVITFFAFADKHTGLPYVHDIMAHGAYLKMNGGSENDH